MITLTPLLLAGLLAGAPALQESAPTNVVVLVADDLGWTGLGCFGSDLYETPHLDALAAEGVRFTAAYSAAPVCSPARVAIHTGLHPARVRLTDVVGAAERPWEKLRTPAGADRLKPVFPTLAQVLRDAGYRTGHFGKWHLEPQQNLPEGTQAELPGFDVHWDRPRAQKGYWSAEEGSRYLTDELTDHALAFIDEAGGAPFYLHVDYHAPHSPIEGRPDLVEALAAKVRPGARHTNPEFGAMVGAIDESAGRLLERLAERGLTDHTLVIFVSDNGGHSELDGQPTGYTDNSPLRGSKGAAYEGGVRVPMIVRWPGVARAGADCATPTIGMDLFPTALEATGAPFEAEEGRELGGLSLVPLLRDPTLGLERDLHWHYPHYRRNSEGTPFGAIRSGNLRLIEFFEDGRLELYDLLADPGETINLSAERIHEARALHQRLDAWRESIKAQVPKPNPNHDPRRASDEVHKPSKR